MVHNVFLKVRKAVFDFFLYFSACYYFLKFQTFFRMSFIHMNLFNYNPSAIVLVHPPTEKVPYALEMILQPHFFEFPSDQTKNPFPSHQNILNIQLIVFLKWRWVWLLVRVKRPLFYACFVELNLSKRSRTSSVVNFVLEGENNFLEGLTIVKSEFTENFV